MSSSVRELSLIALLALFGAACRPSGASAPTTPRPVPTPPPAVTPPPPAPAPNVSAPAAHPFAYAPGIYRYEVRTDAVISAEGQPRVDSVSTRAVITYRITRSDSGMIAVAGTVDTFTVTSSHATAVPPVMNVPFRIDAFPDGRIRDSVLVDSAAVCSSPVSPIVTAGREVLTALPLPLAPAAEWTDSTTTITCRGSVPLIARSGRQSRASWALVPAEWSRQSNDVAFEVARTTTTAISGQGHVAGRAVDLSGQGQGSSLLYVDPEAGILLGGTGNGSTKIVVDAGSQRQEFTQIVHQQLRLLR
jgi:hypothetical protein